MVSVSLMKKLSEVEPPLRDVLFAILEEIEEQKRQWEESVTRTDFHELKEIVRELAQAQARTEQLAQAQERTEERVEQLAQAQQRTEERVEQLALAQERTEQRLDSLSARVEELAEAQKRTEQRVEELALAQQRTEQRLDSLSARVEELAEAQKRTEQRIEELAAGQVRMQEAIERLAAGLGMVREQVGGLARSVAYALENEAYRHLPRFLEEKFGIQVVERIVRAEIAGREINFFGRVRRNGREAHLVGESVLRLDDRSKLGQLQVTVDLAEEALGGEIIPVIVTHFAKKDLLEKAEQRGILVIQSFEW